MSKQGDFLRVIADIHEKVDDAVELINDAHTLSMGEALLRGKPRATVLFPKLNRRLSKIHEQLETLADEIDEREIEAWLK